MFSGIAHGPVDLDDAGQDGQARKVSREMRQCCGNAQRQNDLVAIAFELWSQGANAQ